MPTHSLSQLIVGSFTGAEGGGAGISTLIFDDSGATGPGSTVALDSPNYLIRHPVLPLLYAVADGGRSSVVTLRLGDNGPELINQVDNSGPGPCHLALSPDLRHVVVANYGSGSVSAFSLAAEGQLGEQTDLIEFSGSGPDPDRQEASHPHQAVIDGESILVPDLGLDVIHRLRIDADGRLAHGDEPVRLPAGSGPRHLVLVDDQLVVACELSAEVWWGARTGTGADGQLVPASQSDGSTRIYPSAIVADGHAIFVANRGSDTIGGFTLDRSETGGATVRPAIEVSCGGAWPRDLIITESHLWVANQNDDTVVAIARADLASDRIVTTISTQSPACLIPVNHDLTANREGTSA